MRLPALSAIALLVALAVASAVIAQRAPDSAATPLLRLHRGVFDARQAGGPALSAGLLRAAPGSFAIIQLRGPASARDRAALQATGLELLEYLPDFAYLVRGSPAQIEAASRLPQVYARAPFTLADKLAPALLRALERGDARLGPLLAVAWPGREQVLSRELQAAGIDPSERLDPQALMRMAELRSLRWIEPRPRPFLLNDVAREIMNAGPMWSRHGLLGANQILAVTDSGLDTGDPATLSPDFAGRLVATHVLSEGGDLADQHAHGTHVAGSAAGAGVQSGADPAQHRYGGSFAGVAPEAQLVIQAMEVGSGGETIGLGDDVYPILQQAYNDGARLHTNSWGEYTGVVSDTEAKFGGYPHWSRRADQFMWEHPDSTLFFAAGNSGLDGVPRDDGFCSSNDGVINADSLLAPATAKNVVTVGAAESLRLEGGFQFSWFYFNIFCYGSENFAEDYPSDNPDGMAAFSSRGPTDDDRVKPDIVAPGTNIISNRSHHPDAYAWWGDPYDEHYVYMGGTSMATPLVAGAGTLVREWLTLQGIAEPSGAAVKATLLNTTYDPAPGQYGTGQYQEIPPFWETRTRPNSVVGWGRADLGFVEAPYPYQLWVDDHAAGLATGDVVSYTHSMARPLEVVTNTRPLRVLLAYTDPPASLSAAAQLVNDLDLVVRGPDGTLFYGNDDPDGDTINNVEGVIIDSPSIGRYTVEVHARNVPVAAQPYALAVGGPLNPHARLTLSKRAEPAETVVSGELLTYTLALSTNSRPVSKTVTLSDTLPAGVEFVSASHGATRTGAGGSIVRWSIPSLAANETITRQLVVRTDPLLADGTPIVNSEYLATNGLDAPGIGAPVTVTARYPGRLLLAKAASSSTVAPGELISYTLTVAAEERDIGNVVLTDTLPVDTTFVSASGSYTRSGPGNSIVSWSLGTVSAGQSVSRTLTVQVLPDAPFGSWITNERYWVSGEDVDSIAGEAVRVFVVANDDRRWLPPIYNR